MPYCAPCPFGYLMPSQLVLHPWRSPPPNVVVPSADVLLLDVPSKFVSHFGYFKHHCVRLLPFTNYPCSLLFVAPSLLRLISASLIFPIYSTHLFTCTPFMVTLVQIESSCIVLLACIYDTPKNLFDPPRHLLIPRGTY